MRPPSPVALPLVIPSPTMPVPPPEAQTALLEYHPSYPGFITTAVIEHLESVDGGLCWVEMVKLYLELENKFRPKVSRYSPEPSPPPFTI